MTLFTKIINREIPADIVYEDDLCMAFKDINPQAPVHLLLIPKKEIVNLDGLGAEDSDLIAHMMLKIKEIAAEQRLSGYRVVTNINDQGGQTVFHLHFHILGGRPMAGNFG